MLLIIFNFASFQANAQNSEISVGVLHDDNVDFAPIPEQVASHNVVRVAGETAFKKRLGPFSQVSLTGIVDVNEYSSYPGDHIGLALRAAYTRKLGLGFQAPRLRIALLGETRNYDVNLRDVNVGQVAVGISKPLHERIDLAVNLTAVKHRVKDEQMNTGQLATPFSRNAFDRDFVTAELSTTTYLDSNWSMPISVLFIDGDLVSISKPDPTVLARAIAANNYSEIVPGTIAYRSEGRARSVSFGLDRSLTEHSTLSFLYTAQSGKTGTDTKYSRDLLSLEYTIRW